MRIAVGQAIALLFELAEGSTTDGDDTQVDSRTHLPVIVAVGGGMATLMMSLRVCG